MLVIQELYLLGKVSHFVIIVDRKSWEMIYLSQDQKPSVEAERRRIIKHGGKIQALRD
jgi:hypothetical protein